MKNYYYKVYGLVAQSNLEIPLLAETSPSDLVDLEVEFIEYKTLEDVDVDEENLIHIYSQPAIAKNNLSYYELWVEKNHKIGWIRITDGYSVTVNRLDGIQKKITTFHNKDVSVFDMASFLAGNILGTYLRFAGITVLHAGVVNINGKAVAFFGNKYTGKSTLMYHLAKLGYPLLSDDLAVLEKKNDGYIVHSGYPYIRIWREAVERSGDFKTTELNRVLADMDKYFIPLSTDTSVKNWKFNKEALPIEVCCYLPPRNEEGILKVSTLSPLDKMLKVSQNTYGTYVLTSKEQRREELKILSDFSKHITVKNIDRPNDLALVDDVCQVIIQELSNN